MSTSINTVYAGPEVLKRSIFFGDTFKVLKDPVDFLGKLTKNYGAVVTANFLRKKYFILQHPEYIKNVLLQNSWAYWKRALSFLQKKKRCIKQELS